MHLRVIDEATLSRLVYRTPVLPPDWHEVCDVHSHGTASAYFSATDDSDAHTTKISLVIGRRGHPAGPVMASCLCADGMSWPCRAIPSQVITCMQPDADFAF